MKKTLKILGIIFLILFIPYCLWGINNFIYPLKAVHPNYSDVEAAFAKLQFPADWKEVNSSENRGIHGRGCDFLNDAGCFHKSKTFKVPDNLTKEDVKSLLIQAGCTGVTEQDITPKGDIKPTTKLNCSLGGGVSYGADVTGPTSEVYVSAETF